MTTFDIEAAQQLCDEITPGPWELHVAPEHSTSKAEKVEYLAGTVADTDDPLWLLTAESHEEWFAYVVPAVTGDGPRSKANATFIAAARTLLPDALAEIRQLRAENMERREMWWAAVSRTGSASDTIDRLRAQVQQVEALCESPESMATGDVSRLDIWDALGNEREWTTHPVMVADRCACGRLDEHGPHEFGEPT